MDLAIFAYGISMGLISSILSILGIHFFIKKSMSSLKKWTLAGFLSLGLGGILGGVYFSLDVGDVPGVENPVGLAFLVSSFSSAFFTLGIGVLRGLFSILFKK